MCFHVVHDFFITLMGEGLVISDFSYYHFESLIQPFIVNAPFWSSPFLSLPQGTLQRKSNGRYFERFFFVSQREYHRHGVVGGDFLDILEGFTSETNLLLIFTRGEIWSRCFLHFSNFIHFASP